jgi:hypothetical protein
MNQNLAMNDIAPEIIAPLFTSILEACNKMVQAAYEEGCRDSKKDVLALLLEERRMAAIYLLVVARRSGTSDDLARWIASGRHCAPTSAYGEPELLDEICRVVHGWINGPPREEGSECLRRSETGQVQHACE